MASWVAMVSPASSLKSCPSSCSTLAFYRPSHSHILHYSDLSFPPSPFLHSLQFSSKVVRYASNHSCVVRAQQNEVRFSQWFSLEDLFSNIRSFVNTFLEPSVAYKVAVNDDGESSFAFTKSELYGTEAGDSKPPSSDPSPSSSPSPAAPAADNASSEESISEFIAQVASLVKLVDSRDIVELQLKQANCELVIRKKEALPQPPIMMQPPSPLPATAVPPAEQPSQPVSESAPKSSNLPLLKCPMAGTFYRCPAPGEPPFVKVGDKVKKGQVLCIIEAMKLMNEIEADQSGTIIEVLAEDGKPVSVDTPLFVIEP